MTDDQQESNAQKQQPTEPGGGFLRRFTPGALRNRTEARSDDHSGDRTRGINRRSFMRLAGGAATAVASGAVGTTALQQPSAGRQAGAYGYGGRAALAGTGAEVATSSLSTEVEPNDERETAMEISPGVPVEAQLDAATVDYFAFDATADDPITVEYDRESGVGVTGVVIYGPAGSFKEKLYVGTDSAQQLSTTAETTGTHFLQVMDVEGGDGSYTTTVALAETIDPPDDGGDDPSETGQRPYGGTLRSIPGRVQAEAFDEDGAEIAYVDTTDENLGGEFRPESSVDIERSGATTSEYSVGYTEAGEWLEYSVDLTAGTYQLAVRVSTPVDGCQITVKLDGDAVTTVDLPNTGGRTNWTTVTVDDVEATVDGPQILRVEFLDSDINLNWLEFTTSEEDDYGTQAYGEYEYGGLQ